jgi:LPS export ABC transporter protein LptC/lipopolysaccharide transport protein LptA
MAMTADPGSNALAGRRTGDGMVLAIDRADAFRRARRRTALVRVLRIACPAMAVLLLGTYALSIARTAGLVGGETLPELAIRKILPEDLTMQNPRYEGFGKDGGSYVFTAKTAEHDLALRNVVKLNGITGEIYQPDKTRTDVTATRGVFDNEKNLLELFEEINVDSESGLKARLTRATILTKEDLLTSDEPVLVEFPNGSVRSKRMTLRQKAREATFADEVAVILTPPPDSKKNAEEAAPTADSGAMFTPSNGPITIAANRLDVSDAGKTALFTGSVRTEQAGSYLTTPELEVFYEGEGMMGGSATPPAGADVKAASSAGKVRRIVAKKPVVMKRMNGDVVTSDSADFDAETQSAVLSGEVIMTSGTNRRAAGDRVEIDEAQGTILLTGNVSVMQGGNELRGGRLALDRTGGTARLTTPPEAGLGPGRIAARLEREGDPRRAKTVADTQRSNDQSPLGTFKTNPDAPIEITADSLDVDDKRKLAVFRGDVDSTQDTFNIRSGELTAFYKGEAGLVDAADPSAPKSDRKAELTRVEARKDVHVTSKDGQTATGDWADFDTRANKVTMGGNVVLSKGKSMVRGTRLVIDLATGESKIDTAPQNTVSAPSGGGWVTKTPAEPGGEGKGRASAVFFPQELKKDEDSGAKSKAKAPSAATDGWSATAEPNSATAPAN